MIDSVAESSDRHVEQALRTALEENLAIVRDTVSHLRSGGWRMLVVAQPASRRPGDVVERYGVVVNYALLHRESEEAWPGSWPNHVLTAMELSPAHRHPGG